jgi:nucleoside-diphosphate-sugar epimerase
MNSVSTLVTGITGFIGSEYFKTIIDDKKNSYYLLVRPERSSHWQAIVESFSHINVIVGDLIHSDLFLQPPHDLYFDRVVHLAALYDLKATYAELYKANVVGTQNLLFYISQHTSVREIFYASTIAVAGNWPGVFSEDDFDLGQDFPDSYAKTKFQAEECLRKFSTDNPQINITIARFGIVVGDSKTGYMPRVDGPYYLLKELSRLKNFKSSLVKWPKVFFPYKKDSEIPLVPIDFAAAIINNLKDFSKTEGKSIRVVHVIAEDCPTNGELMQDFLKVMGISIKVDALNFPGPWAHFIKRGLRLLSLPESLHDYMNTTLKLTSHQLKKELKNPELIPHYKDFSATILKYSLDHFNYDK